MARARWQEADVGPRQPGLDTGQRRLDRHWRVEQPSIRCDANEPEQNRARDADLSSTVQELLPPRPRLGVLGERLDVGVKKYIHVGDDHRRRGCNFAAIASSSSSSTNRLNAVGSN